MGLKTYQSYSMAEALAAVKRDLGAGAVILNTRSFKRGGLFGLGRRTVFEVTATTSEGARSALNQKKEGAAGSRSRRALLAYAAGRKSGGEGAGVNGDAGATEQDRIKTRRLAQSLLEQQRRRELEAAQPLTGGDEALTSGDEGSARSRGGAAGGEASAGCQQSVVLERPNGASGAGRDCRSVQLPVAQRFVLRREGAETGWGGPGGAAKAKAPSGPGGDGAAVGSTAGSTREEAGGRALAALYADVGSGGGPEASGECGEGDGQVVRDELSAIRQMVGEVLQRQARSSGVSTPTMPKKLFDMYLRLIGQEVSEELADRIVNDVRDELSALELEDEATVREAVVQHMSDYIPVAEEAVATGSGDGRPLTIALIGPTGVGKTTTLAKLAASFKLRHHRKVGVITADTYRIAAVDQLRTYANIIGLPLRVALTPREMRQSVEALSECEVILIDTAGRSQHDAGRLEELRGFLEAARPHETHLVLSSTASEKVLLGEAEAFSEVGVDKVILTKLDEAVSFGMVVSALRQIGRELSFFTTGQEVPDQIEVSRPRRLAELVLGGGMDG